MAFGWDDAAKLAAPALGIVAGIGAGKRQIKQQKKLNELGIDAYRQQREIDQANQMEMWNATNVEAQIAHMKNAGMSISAMYGGSGGGGTTAGSGGGSAPIATADGETARQAMALQIGRQTAELALMQAQTKKTEAEADNIAGVDKENKQAQTDLLNSQKTWQDLQNRIGKETEHDQRRAIVAESSKLAEEAEALHRKNKISQETFNDEIKKIKQDATNTAILANAMRQGIEVDKAKVKEISANIQNMLDNVELRKGDQKINVENMEKLTEAMLWGAGIQATGNLVNSIIDIRSGKFMKPQQQRGSHQTTTKYDKQGNEIGSQTKTIRGIYK